MSTTSPLKACEEEEEKMMWFVYLRGVVALLRLLHFSFISVRVNNDGCFLIKNVRFCCSVVLRDK